jgi:hypothetical protein
VASLSTKNGGNSQKKISYFVEIIVPLAKLAKHGNIQINETTKNTSTFKSHKKNHSTKLRLTKNYVTAYMSNFISLNL